MSFELPLPPIEKHHRRTFQATILCDDDGSGFQAWFSRRSVFYSDDGTVLFVVNDPSPIAINSEDLHDRPDLISAVMLIQMEVDRLDRARLIPT